MPNSRSNKKLPPISARALPQSKHDLANVLDVGCHFRFVCAPPLSHPLAVHCQLDYGVVIAERLTIFYRFGFKLVLYVLCQRAQISPQCTHDLVVFRFTFRFRRFDQLVPLEHFITSEINYGLTLGLASRFNLLLEVFASWIVLGDVLQPPTIRTCDLFPQRLVREDVGASNFTRRFHSVSVELDFVSLYVRILYELVFMCRALAFHIT